MGDEVKTLTEDLQSSAKDIEAIRTEGGSAFEQAKLLRNKVEKLK